MILRKGGGNGPEFPVKRRTCVFGSTEDCEIMIKRNEVQEQHAKIEVQAVSNLFYITNLAYAGGVLINEKEMAASQKLQLAHKDVITICGRKFMVDIPGMIDHSAYTTSQRAHYLIQKSFVTRKM